MSDVIIDANDKESRLNAMASVSGATLDGVDVTDQHVLVAKLGKDGYIVKMVGFTSTGDPKTEKVLGNVRLYNHIERKDYERMLDYYPDVKPYVDLV